MLPITTNDLLVWYVCYSVELCKTAERIEVLLKVDTVGDTGYKQQYIKWGGVLIPLGEGRGFGTSLGLRSARIFVKGVETEKPGRIS